MTGPSSGRVAWIDSVTPLWAARAAALRTEGNRSADIRASVLDSVVTRLRGELAAHASSGNPYAAEITRLEAIVARSTGPYLHPEWGVMVNDAPFLDDVHHALRCRIARLRGDAPPAYLYRCTLPPDQAPAPPAALPPTPEAVPFRAGPQLTLFEIAA